MIEEFGQLIVNYQLSKDEFLHVAFVIYGFDLLDLDEIKRQRARINSLIDTFIVEANRDVQ